MEHRKFIRFVFFTAIVASLIIFQAVQSRKRTSSGRRQPPKVSNRPDPVPTKRPARTIPRPPGPYKPPKGRVTSKPKKPSVSNKDFVKRIGKIVVATYLAKKMQPAVRFRRHKGYGKNHRPAYCHKCISVNGSDISCEEGISQDFTQAFEKKCYTAIDRPYCSTEYGITADNLPYLRRSCDDRQCRGCSSHLPHTDRDSRCYSIKCDACNWNNCNNEMSTKMTSKWEEEGTGSDDVTTSRGDRSNENVNETWREVETESSTEIGQETISESVTESAEEQRCPQGATCASSTISMNAIISLVTVSLSAFSLL